MTHDDLKRYNVKSSFMTKSFLSSSIEEKVALCCLCRQELEREEKTDGSLVKQ